MGERTKGYFGSFGSFFSSFLFFPLFLSPFPVGKVRRATFYSCHFLVTRGWGTFKDAFITFFWKFWNLNFRFLVGNAGKALIFSKYVCIPRGRSIPWDRIDRGKLQSGYFRNERVFFLNLLGTNPHVRSLYKKRYVYDMIGGEVSKCGQSGTNDDILFIFSSATIYMLTKFRIFVG